jgi:hypothetical protein
MKQAAATVTPVRCTWCATGKPSKPPQGNLIMNATQANTQAALQIAAQDLSDVKPVLVEELSIDELAVREEYSACYTINNK